MWAMRMVHRPPFGREGMTAVVSSFVGRRERARFNAWAAAVSRGHEAGAGPGAPRWVPLAAPELWSRRHIIIKLLVSLLLVRVYTCGVMQCA